MYRVIFHLIIIYSIFLLHFRNFKDDNYRQQLDESLSSGKCEQGLIIANSWLREDPYSHYAWYCLGRLRLETALSKSRNEDFMMSLESFEKAIRLFMIKILDIIIGKQMLIFIWLEPIGMESFIVIF